MAAIEKKPIKITETVLRDAHQSLIATRLTTEQMLPIVDKMDKVGYHSVECWGGATFDASLRFLHEDPWSRLRKFRDGFKNTKLQMLFRGQNILGYRPYADDVVEYFVKKSVANGIDIIRIFDCLNDLRNLQTAVKAANSEKAEAQIALSYTLGDAYTLDYWVDIAKRIEDMGANSICIKDMAGLLLPYKATELVGALKEAVDIPIQLHTHYTSGVASMTYLKAVEAGVDVIDTAISPFALGTSQPATEVMVETFKGTPYDTGLTRIFWLRSLITSVRSVTKHLTADFSIRRTLVLTSRLFCTRYRVECFLTLLPSSKSRAQKTSSTTYLKKYREFVKILVNHRWLLRHHRSLVHRQYSMS